jgi:thymidylate synthase
MKQYLDLLQNILDNGVEKESGRANMPNTLEISMGRIEMDLQKGFPLLTTKKMFLKGIIHELLWFLRGDTNIKYLVDNDVNIWNGDAYRWYCTMHKKYTKNDYPIWTEDEFIALIKEGADVGIGDPKTGNRAYKIGDLGKVYGHQWRNQNGVDQIADIIKDLKENPYGRYKILDGWNKADFRDMALPPCHLLYHFIVRPISNKERNEWYRNNGPIHTNRFDPDSFYNDEFLSGEAVPKYYLDLNMYQRSCDTFLGVPFNIASMALLLMIIAKSVDMIPGIANWIGGHTHLYVDHIPVVREQLSREPLPLPTMKINKVMNGLEDILELTFDDFELSGYKYLPRLRAELFTGIKK